MTKSGSSTVPVVPKIKSRTDPNTYKVLEIYADQDALTLHGGTDYFKAAGPKIGACLAGRPEIEYLDGV